MKISIGTKIKDGPWGGGNLFAINLTNYLIKKGHQVIYNLNDDDIDLILITEPRRTSESSAFTHIDVENYLKYVKRDSLVIHRVNECDERKNTNYVNKYLIQANSIADATVFVSSWLEELFTSQGIDKRKNNVIRAGADSTIFNNTNHKPWNKNKKLRIVTHHWGDNWNKGFEIYKMLDDLLSKESISKKIKFTYIGNIPKKFTFKNTEVLTPLYGVELAEELKKNHIYLTGSLNEPSGNHHIEGAQCGLPLLYINSGGIPEYCNGFGVSFDSHNFVDKLNEIIKNYDLYLKRIEKYPFSSEKMCQDYESLFNELNTKKEEIFDQRKNTYNSSVLGKFMYKSIKKIKSYNTTL
jgi:hypothetical protein